MHSHILLLHCVQVNSTTCLVKPCWNGKVFVYYSNGWETGETIASIHLTAKHTSCWQACYNSYSWSRDFQWWYHRYAEQAFCVSRTKDPPPWCGSSSKSLWHSHYSYLNCTCTILISSQPLGSILLLKCYQLSFMPIIHSPNFTNVVVNHVKTRLVHSSSSH